MRRTASIGSQSPTFSILKCQFNLELLMIPSQALWQESFVCIIPTAHR